MNCKPVKTFNFNGAARRMNMTVWGKLASMAVYEAVSKYKLFKISKICSEK